MRQLFLCRAVSCIAALVLTVPAEGETIINVPPDPAPLSVGFDEVLNLLDDGDLRSANHRRFQANDGSTVNIFGGTVGHFFHANSGSTVHISGGTVGVSFKANSGSTVHIFGGTVGSRFEAFSGSAVTVVGEEFQIDGQLVPGLDEVGDRVSVNIPAESGVAGVLSDGNVFAYGSFGGYSFADGTLTLLRGPDLPPAPMVFNVPSDPAPQGLRGGQTLNLRDGGQLLGNDFSALAGSVLNVMGGTVTNRFGNNSGSTVNVFSGIVGSSFDANIGSTVNISGGTVGAFFDANSGSTVNISGGTVGAYFDANSGSTVNISGGTVGPLFDALAGSTVRLFGEAFQIDGQTVPGLDQIGDQVPLNVPDGSVVAGVLSDGTVVAFGSFDFDTFADGTLTLVRAADLPPAPALINLPADPVPLGVRGGQTLNLHEGGQLVDGFTTLGDSVVNVIGGTVGRDFVTNSGSTVNISGGTVGESFNANRGSTINISGGTMGRGFDAFSGSTVRISGGELQIDGQLVSGLNEVGDQVPVNLPAGSVVAGVLGDGTVFSFGHVGGDSFADGTLTLVRAADLPPATAVIDVPSDPVPLGLRRGQTLNLHEGGRLGEISLLAGSVVNIMGGTVDGSLHVAAGSRVNISDGSAGWVSTYSGSTTNISGGEVEGLFAGAGSTVNISGGSVGGESTAGAGSTVNISGGTVDHDFEVNNGATVNVSGGALEDIDAYSGSLLNISGGTVWRVHAHSNSIVNVTGGAMGRDVFADRGAMMNISGEEFQIDGQTVRGLNDVDDRVTVRIPAGSVVAGVLSDGNVFVFGSLEGNPWVEVGTLTLIRGPALPPAPAVFNVPSGSAPHGLRTGQALNLRYGGELGREFIALGGSVVNIIGGTVGRDLAAIRSTVNISGGTVDTGFLALDHSTINITGGDVGRYFKANGGSTVNIFGGTVDSDFIATGGSTVNISGGMVGHRFSAASDSTVNISGGTVGQFFHAFSGSTVNITGGTVGRYLGVSGATVNISGGIVGNDFGFNSRSGSTVNISGGTVGRVSTRGGWIVNISGGTVGHFRAEDGSLVNITGGTFVDGLSVEGGSTVSISGGTVMGGFDVRGKSTANISGGTHVGAFRASSGSTVNLFGTEFLLSGQPIAGLDEVGDSLILSDRGISRLEVTLRDGGQRSFFLGDYRFATDATLTLTFADLFTEGLLLSDLTGNGFVDFEDLTVLLANWNKQVGADAGNLVNATTTPVNFEDLTVLLADWTGPGPAASPQAALDAEAVPEPSSLVLLAIAALGMSVGWRRRRSA